MQPLVAVLLLASAAAPSHSVPHSYVTPAASRALLRPMSAGVGAEQSYPGGPCPCANASVCDTITTPRFADGKELFIFHVAGEPSNFDQWRHYDYSRITAIAVWEFAPLGAEERTQAIPTTT